MENRQFKPVFLVLSIRKQKMRNTKLALKTTSFAFRIDFIG